METHINNHYADYDWQVDFEVLTIDMDDADFIM